MKVDTNFTVPSAVFTRMGFRALPNRFDRGAMAQRFNLVNRGGMTHRGVRALGMRGLGAGSQSMACPQGYHSYTADGVNWTCEADVYTQAANYSAGVIASEVNLNPQDALAQYMQQYGMLPQDVQTKLYGCKLQQSNAQVFGTPLDPACAGSDQQLIAQFMPTASTAPGNAPTLVLTKTGYAANILPTTIAPLTPTAPAPSPAPPPPAPKPSTTPSMTSGAQGTTNLVAPAGTSTGTPAPSTAAQGAVSAAQQQAQAQAQAGAGDNTNLLIIAAIAAGVLFMMSGRR